SLLVGFLFDVTVPLSECYVMIFVLALAALLSNSAALYCSSRGCSEAINSAVVLLDMLSIRILLVS
ncbi:hypothetical protein HAX54_034292, partial [Datura stramonium]|nr:hypothetical protein [Datura stramonium]